jgi:hypothetical protein
MDAVLDKINILCPNSKKKMAAIKMPPSSSQVWFPV